MTQSSKQTGETSWWRLINSPIVVFLLSTVVLGKI